MAKIDHSKRIAFIGGGNMAGAIIGGLLATGYPAQNMIVSEPVQAARDNLKAKFNVLTTASNADAVSFNGDSSQPADIVVLAVKPQIMKDVAHGIAPVVQKAKPVVITIAAGITLTDLGKWLSTDAQNNTLEGAQEPALVRVMPNTPALVSEGATGMYAASSVSAGQKDLAFNVLGAVSKSTYWVDSEALLDVVTGLSGSGPAYFFLMVESLADAATELGLPRDVALGLARQTCMGAGRMLVDTQEDPAELRQKVTSPNGTTHAAIQSLEASGMRKAFKGAVIAATKRGEELGKMFSQ
ncbi:pyrroline-5-carboxylate reductase dimerization-domain-containing protein [Gaertneriomyces semiglobifer]|nr:pyrroline-5-carboxylate reductase dimerization-domain-containing protein [Gaertneriomyces semiglobifer]